MTLPPSFARRGEVHGAAESCVVYGMPRVVVEAGLSDASAPVEEMAALLERYVR